MQILRTLAVPGKLPSLHLRSVFTVDGLQERGKPLGEPLSNHFHSDKFLGASSCHASQLGAPSSMKSPVKLKEKVMLSVEKSQGRNCKQNRFEDYKVGSTFFDTNCFTEVMSSDVKIDWKC